MTDSTHKYARIAEALRREIGRTRPAPHQPFLTDHEAVRRFGASRITIRRAFSILEEEGLIYRVRGRGTMINPNPGKKIRFVAVMGECLVRNGIEPLIIRGAEDQFALGETNLIICNMENSPRRAMQYARRLAEIDIDGVIMIPMLKEGGCNQEVIDVLDKKGIPVVLVGRSVPELGDRVSSVIPDNYSGGREIAHHFASLGHTRVAFLRSIDFGLCSALRDRHAGFLQGLKEKGLELDPALDLHSTRTELPLVVRRWMAMPNPPTAVFLDNDIALVRFVEVAQARGIRIPEQLSVAGFDDLPGFPSGIPHTTIHVPHDEIGCMAATQLIEMIRNPEASAQQTQVPVHLVIRKSTGIASTLRQPA